MPCLLFAQTLTLSISQYVFIPFVVNLMKPWWPLQYDIVSQTFYTVNIISMYGHHLMYIWMPMYWQKSITEPSATLYLCIASIMIYFMIYFYDLFSVADTNKG